MHDRVSWGSTLGQSKAVGGLGTGTTTETEIRSGRAIAMVVTGHSEDA